MSTTFVRRSAAFCLLLAASLTSVFAVAAKESNATRRARRTPNAVESSHVSIEGTSRGFYSAKPITIGGSVLAYAPRSVEKPITVVYLHGMNGKAANGCPYLREGASEVGWLVCPNGIEHNAERGTASWGADPFKQAPVVNAAIHAAEAEGASSEPGVAVGFSQGSYVALDLVKTGQSHFRGLVLLAAPEAHPSAAKLQQLGVKRVALGAGSLDLRAYEALKADVVRLQNEGMDARFVDLGRVGHTYAGEDSAPLREAIEWASGV